MTTAVAPVSGGLTPTAEVGERSFSDGTLTTVSIIESDGGIKFAGTGLRGHVDKTGRGGPRKVFDSVVPQHRQAALELFASVATGQQQFAAMTLQFRRSDGEVRWADVQLFDHRGNPQVGGILLVTRDVTAERNDAESLSLLRDADHFLGESARTLATALLDDVSRVMADTVAAAAAFLGAKHLTLSTGALRISDPGSLDPDAQDSFTTMYRWSAPGAIPPYGSFEIRGFGAELARWFRGPRPPRWVNLDRLETRLIRANPSAPRPGEALLLYGVKLPTDHWGVLALWDPTHREAAEFMISGLADLWSVAVARNHTASQRQRSESRLETLLAHSSDLLVVHDQNLILTYVSPGAKSLLDISPDDALGRSIVDYVHPEDRSIIDQVSLRPGVATNLQHVRLRAADGSYRTFDIVATNLLSDPNVAGVVVNGRDVTDLAMAREALRRRRSLEQLVRRVSTTFATAPVDMTDELLGSCLEDLVSFSKAMRACIFVPEAPGSDLVVRHHFSHRSESHARPPVRLSPEFIESLGRSFAAGAIYVQTRGRGDQRLIDTLEATRQADTPIAGIVAVPLQSGEELMGVLLMSSDDPNWTFSSEHLGLLRTIGEIGAGALMRQRVEQTLAKGALFDPLTGLPNRRMLMTKLTATLSRAQDQPVAVMFVDCDEFKAVNDSYGHEYGDRLLVRMARRLETVCAPMATLARLGGDEFVVMIDSMVGEADVVDIAKNIVSSLNEEYDLDGATVRVTVSVGVAIHSPVSGSTDTGSLLRRADVAMYQAKQAGRNRVHVYSEELESSTRARFSLLTDLRRATETTDQFDVWYQPVFDLRSRGAIPLNDRSEGVDRSALKDLSPIGSLESVFSTELAGYEALVRWRHPTRGLVLPADFIDLAEDSGVINELGWYVFQTAVEQLVTWRSEGRIGDHVGIAVNVSVRQLQSSRLMERVRSLLENAALPPRLVTLEVTESVLADRSNVLRELTKLHSLGLRIAIDDFGTGYSSLAYLRDFPIDVLKVDRSFVGKLGSDRRENAVVAMMCQLAEQMGVVTVAEGIETARQLELVRSLGCDFAQGFLLGRPVTASETHKRPEAAVSER